jgi:hypothetical protein
MKNIYAIKYPSLYFNWLPNSFMKGLSIPKLLFIDDVHYGGVYCPVQENKIFDFDLKHTSIIIINIDNVKEDQELASTIAHEMRHHYQTYKFGIETNIIEWKESYSSSINTYKDNIIKYFNSSIREMDALNFQIKYAPHDIVLLWKEWIIYDINS